jgi:colanic acid biosynthesis glycosyl transferase WcaI
MGDRRDIVLINQYFYPSDAATAVLLRELVEDLSSEFALTVVCESAASGVESSKYSCVRLAPPAWIRDDEAIASRGLRWLTSFLFLVRAAWWVLTTSQRSLIILASEPPFLDSVLGALCWMRRQKFMIIVQDLYPEFAAAVNLRPVSFFTRALGRWHSFISRRSCGVVAISKDHEKLLAQRGVSPRACIPNWAPTSCGDSSTGELPFPSMDGPLIVHYAGNLGLACDLEALTQALEGLAAQGQLEKFRVVLRGDGIKREAAQRLAATFPQVSMVSRVPVGDVASAMGGCHVHLVLTPAKLKGCVYPSKIQSILAAGRPIIASVPSGSSIAEFIRTHEVGYVSAAEEPSQLAEAMMRCLRDMRGNPDLLREMGQRGCRYVAAHWNRRLAVEQYRALLEEVVHDHKS